MRFLILTLLLIAGLSASPLAAQVALRNVEIFDGGRAPRARASGDSTWLHRAWPFCPTDRTPCSAGELAWIQLEAALDVYSARRNDPHDSVGRLLAVTRGDLAPLTVSLERYFTRRGLSSQTRRVGFVQGLVQGVTYRNDVETGWAEYPKFGLEFLVDQQGDCDDAAIALGVLLESLGYSAFFVSWVSEGSAGHLSTAVRPNRGDLRSFEPPDGSPWIEHDRLRLLHVDGTGIPDGCGKSWTNCSPLGFNPWPESGLTIHAVVATSDQDIDRKLPLGAWNNGGRERPNRVLVDRRNASDREIRDEQLLDRRKQRQRLRERLQAMGIDADQVQLRSIYPVSRNAYQALLAFCLSVVLLLVGRAWHLRKQRLERVALKKAQRRRDQL